MSSNLVSPVQIFSVVSTKGGVGKTTLTAYLAALLADLGLRVLMVDADVQPSLTKFYPVTDIADYGLAEVLNEASITERCISKTSISRLHIICSNESESTSLQHWLANQGDRLIKLRLALRSSFVQQHYDVVVVDTQGAVGALQEAAVCAADTLISPTPPDIISAREFFTGMVQMVNNVARQGVNLGITPPRLRSVIYRQDRTRNAAAISELIRDRVVSREHDLVHFDLMQTVVPAAKAYTEAATSQVPVHRHEPIRSGRSGAGASAGDVMHQLVYELMPALEGMSAYGAEAA